MAAWSITGSSQLNTLAEVLVYLLIPAILMLAGGVLAFYWTPGVVVRSSLQHFAAGVVFAVVSVELLPDIVHQKAPGVVALGFALGVALMLGLRWLTRGSEAGEGGNPAGLTAGVAIDITIDGLLLGIGFAAGAKVGKLLAAGLSLELLSLGLATTVAFNRAGFTRKKSATILVAMAGLFVGSGVAGDTLLHGLNDTWLAGVLSFGSAALLYLVTEELLAEAHEAEDTAVATAMFFVGFLVLLLLSMLGG